MPNIYQLSTEVQNLYDELLNSIDEETGEIDNDIMTALDVKKEEFEAKAIDIATIVRILKTKKAEVKAEIDRLTAISKKFDKSIERVENVLSTSCLRLGYDKINGIKANISFRTSKRTIIDDIEALPDEFKKCKVEYAADATKIKAAIENGQEVAGAHIETYKNIQIK